MTSAIHPASTPLPAPATEGATHADPYGVYLSSLDSDESKRTMRGALDRIAQIQTGDDDATGAGQPWWLLRYEHTTQIRSKLIEKYNSPSHINKHLNGLRRVLEECWRLELMTAEDYHRAASIKNVKAKRLLAGRNISADELGKMLQVCDRHEGPAGRRNAALIALLYCTGLRRFEAAEALIENYDHAERTLHVIGKRNKERSVPLMLAVIPPLDRWLVLLGVRRGPIFRPIHYTGKIAEKALSSRAVGYIVDLVREEAGLAPLSTHDFRRTFIGNFLDANGDVAQAQQIAGHALTTTTVQYDRRPGRALRDAVDKMSLPLPHDESETR